MCSVDAQDKDNVPIPSDTSSGGARQIKIKSSKKALYSLGHIIKLLYNWIQYFDDDYHNIITI